MVNHMGEGASDMFSKLKIFLKFLKSTKKDKNRKFNSFYEIKKCKTKKYIKIKQQRNLVIIRKIFSKKGLILDKYSFCSQIREKEF